VQRQVPAHHPTWPSAILADCFKLVICILTIVHKPQQRSMHDVIYTTITNTNNGWVIPLSLNKHKQDQIETS